MTRTLRSIVAAFALSFAFAGIVAAPGCKTPPSERVAATQSLIAVGHIAESAVATAARLYQDGKITAASARVVMDIYDRDFAPAFRAAVAASQDRLTPASPELIELAARIVSVVAQLQSQKP